jgi:hypothetical protein
VTASLACRQLVRDRAQALRHELADADRWTLEAALMLDPLQRVVAFALAWSLDPDSPTARTGLDAADDELQACCWSSARRGRCG